MIKKGISVYYSGALRCVAGFISLFTFLILQMPTSLYFKFKSYYLNINASFNYRCRI
jgi:hypothetical protein